MEPSQIVAIVRRWWLLLVLATVVGGVLAYQLASASTARYEATTQLLVGPINADSDVLRAAGQLAITYAELAQSDGTLAVATQDLDVAQPEDVRVTATGSEVTRLLTITVRYPDADTAAAIANALGAELADLASGENGNASGGVEGRVGVIEEATAPTAPVQPEVEAIAVLGGLGGFVTATTLLIAVEQLSRRIRSASDLSDASGVPVLAVLGSQRPSPDGREAAERLVVSGISHSRTARSFRTAAARLETLEQHGGPVRTIVIAGTDSGEGSGDVAANLAASLAELGERVVLADADPLQSGIAPLLGLNGAVGNARNSNLVPVPVRSPHPLLVAAPNAWMRQSRIDAEGAALLLDELKDNADIVVIHAGQAPSSLPTLVWAGLADATVLVARLGVTRWDDVEESVRSLHRVDGKLVGTLLDERGRERRWWPARLPLPRAWLSRAGRARPAAGGVPTGLGADPSGRRF